MPKKEHEEGNLLEDGEPKTWKPVFEQPKVSLFLKGSVLLALLCQNTTYTLVRRYSMAVLHEKYDASECLLMGEVFKLFFAIAMTLADSAPSDAGPGGAGRWELHAMGAKLWYLARSSGKMLTLAAIYGVMNVLSYVSIRRVDAAVFTVCAQLKILTTAAFSVVLLRRRVSATKWRALLQLVLGCVLVTVPQISSVVHAHDVVAAGAANGTLDFAETAAASAKSLTFAIGVGAVVLEVTMSGFASIYFEKVVKTAEENLTVWDRNCQLAMHSIALYVAYAAFERHYFYDPNAEPYRPLHDFSSVAWFLALLGGGGGLLVAMTVKVADSVLKTLATSISIVTSTLASHYILGGPLDLPMAIGALVVALAVLNYTLDSSPVD